MRNVYRIAGLLIAIAVALQAYHSIGGMIIGLLALVLLIASFMTDVPRGRTLAGVVVLLVALQFVLATVSFGVPALGVLHGLNGLAVAAVASVASRRAVVPKEPVTSA
ncbi:MAG: hypothetical protein HOV67_37265 [Kribbellaceae bacterium]|nr:hypothetical protein [Kribbellaceae bacterium]